MRIAYVLLYYPYPTETFVANEIARLRRMGIDIDVCALLPLKQWYGVKVDATEGVIRPPGVLSREFWSAQFAAIRENPRLYARLLRWGFLHGGRSPVDVAKQLVILMKAIGLAGRLRRRGVSLVHSHFASLSSLGGLTVGRLLNVPFTLTAHAYDIYQRPHLVPLLVAQADRVVAIARSNRNHILALCPRADPEQIEVIHCGVDLREFNPNVRERSSSEHVRILSVGRLTRKKGQRVLIEACRRMRDMGQSFECRIVGDGPLKAELEQAIESMGLRHRVRLEGHLPPSTVAGLLKSADIFVLPCQVDPGGDRDGIPVSLMEAMATELPVVTTPVSGIPELVRHGRNGLLVPPEDPPALADALMALARNAWLRRTLGRCGRETVAAEFNAARSAAQMARLFVRVAAKGAPPGPRRLASESDPARAKKMEQQA